MSVQMHECVSVYVCVCVRMCVGTYAQMPSHIRPRLSLCSYVSCVLHYARINLYLPKQGYKRILDQLDGIVGWV